MANSKQHFFYVLYCRDGSLYGGYTTDLARRLQEHNEGVGAKYTRPSSRRPAYMVYAERWASRSQASSAEYHFKQLSRPDKLAYLAENGQAEIESRSLVIVDKFEEEAED